MRVRLYLRLITFGFALAVSGFAQQPANPAAAAANGTLFVTCGKNRVLGPVSSSEDGQWCAYVEVTTDSQCLHTTRLWVSRGDGPYRLIYLMPPKRSAVGNGMQILGWARQSRMVLTLTEEWQDGSDAADLQRVLAIDAGSGMAYEPDLEAMLEGHKGKQCGFRVTDAGFANSTDVVVLVRARLYTATEVDEAEEDVPADKRCTNAEETWSFNFADGQIAPVKNSEPLQVFKQFVTNPLESDRDAARCAECAIRPAGRPDDAFALQWSRERALTSRR